MLGDEVENTAVVEAGGHQDQPTVQLEEGVVVNVVRLDKQIIM